jgi:cold shock CspA family protein
MPGNPLDDLPAVIGQLNSLTNLTGKQFDDESPSFQGPLGQRFSGHVSRTDDSTSRCFVKSDDPALRAVGDIECRFAEVLTSTNKHTLSMGDRVNFFAVPQASAPPASEPPSNVPPSSDEVGATVGVVRDTPTGDTAASVGAAAGGTVGAAVAPTVTVPPASELSSVLTDQYMTAVGVTLVFEFVTGTVARVEDARGFCFIHQDGTATDSRDDVFCHFSSLLNTEKVVVDERVQFAVVNGNKGPQATHVTTLGEPRTRRDAFSPHNNRGARARGEGDRGPSRGGGHAAGRHGGRSQSSRSGDGPGGSRFGEHAHVVNLPVEEHRRDTRGGGDGDSGGGHGGGCAAAGSSVGGSGGDDTAASGNSGMSTHWASTEPVSMQPMDELYSAPTYIPSWRGPVAPTVSVQQDTQTAVTHAPVDGDRPVPVATERAPPPN